MKLDELLEKYFNDIEINITFLPRRVGLGYKTAITSELSKIQKEFKLKRKQDKMYNNSGDELEDVFVNKGRKRNK